MTHTGYTGPVNPPQNRAFRPVEERVEHALHGADGPWMAQKTQARGSMGHGSTIRASDGVQLGRHVVEPGPLGASRAPREKKDVTRRARGVPPRRARVESGAETWCGVVLCGHLPDPYLRLCWFDRLSRRPVHHQGICAPRKVAVVDTGKPLR